MGDASLVLDMKIIRDRESGIRMISQEHYYTPIAVRVGMEGYNPVHTTRAGAELPINQREKTTPEYTGTEVCRFIVGPLLFMGQCRRYNITHGANQMGRPMGKPSKFYITATKRRLRHLKGEISLVIAYMVQNRLPPTNRLMRCDFEGKNLTVYPRLLVHDAWRTT